MGTIRKPCAKVSDRSQMATIDCAVGQYSATSAPSARMRSGNVVRHEVAVGSGINVSSGRGLRRMALCKGINRKDGQHFFDSGP